MTDTNELREAIVDIIKRQIAPLKYENMWPEHQQEVDNLIELITAQTQAAYKRGYIDGGIEQLTTMDKNA